jgi:hypothetical protein
VPKTVFHIVAKDPQVKHVASQVKPPGMHEHGGKERQKISNGIGQEAAGDEGPLYHKSITATKLYDEKQDVQGDQGIRDQRKCPARAIVITDGEHRIHSPLLWLQTPFYAHDPISLNVILI